MTDTWNLTPLDNTVIKMVNAGNWLFAGSVDEKRLQSSLCAVLQLYPLFTYRMLGNSLVAQPNTIATDSVPVPFCKVDCPQWRCADLKKLWTVPRKMQAAFNLKEFLAGKCAPLSVKVVTIADGVLVSVALAHVCADGSTLYHFMSDWSRLFQGKKAEAPSFDQSVIPKPKRTKDTLMKLLPQLGWHQVGASALWLLLAQGLRNVFGKHESVNFVSNSEIDGWKEMDSTLSTHALIGAYMVDMLAKSYRYSPSQQFTVVSTIDLRGHLDIPKNFVGNAVTNFVSQPFTVTDIPKMAHCIQSDLQAVFDNPEKMRDLLMLNMEAMEAKLPFVAFDLKGSMIRKPVCIVINNFLKFPIYDICFGSVPVKVFPNQLPDKLKVWRTHPKEDGVYMLLKDTLA